MRDVRTTIRHVQNLRRPELCWCLQWQTPHMPGPAFWYFATQDEATAAEERLTRDGSDR